MKSHSLTQRETIKSAPVPKIEIAFKFSVKIGFRAIGRNIRLYKNLRDFVVISESRASAPNSTSITT